MLGITRRAAVMGSAADGHPARLFRGGEPGFCLPSVAEALRSGALLRDAAANLAVAGDTIHTIYNQTNEVEIFPSAVSFTGESSQISPGVYRLLSTAGAFSIINFSLPHNTYRVTFTVSGLASGFPTLTSNINDITIAGTNGGYSRVINRASSDIALFGIKRGGGVTDMIISNVRFFTQASGVGAQQSTATKRPLLTTDSKGIPLLRFEIDDCLVTPNLNFSACEAVTVIAGLRKTTGTTTGTVIEHGTGSGRLALISPFDSTNAGDHVYAEMQGSASGGQFASGTATAGTVVGQVFAATVSSRADKLLSYIVNGNTAFARTTGGTDPVGAAAFQNAALFVGQTGATSRPLSGDLYSLTVIGRRLSNSEMLNTSRWINQQMGGVY